MGYMRHHAIIVTTWDVDRAVRAHARAVKQGMSVTEIVTSPVNGYWTFLVAPDGSKEGWPASDDGDHQRLEFCTWLMLFEPNIDWCLVRYGDEEGQNAMLGSSPSGLDDDEVTPDEPAS